MTSYSLVLPAPWVRIPVGKEGDAVIADLVERSIERASDDVSPDQLAQARIKLTEMLRSQLKQAEDAGGLDFYLPADLMRGVRISASILVTAVLPDSMAPAGSVGPVMAELLRRDPDAKPITAGDTVWIRTESVVDHDDAEVLDDEVRGRKVEYVTAAPDDERRWYLVAFTTLGDGDPDSEFTGLLVELFDAIMSTWRWSEDTLARRSQSGEGTHESPD